jgi:hypothetical protein
MQGKCIFASSMLKEKPSCTRTSIPILRCCLMPSSHTLKKSSWALNAGCLVLDCRFLQRAQNPIRSGPRLIHESNPWRKNQKRQNRFVQNCKATHGRQYAHSLSLSGQNEGNARPFAARVIRLTLTVESKSQDATSAPKSMWRSRRKKKLEPILKGSVSS